MDVLYRTLNDNIRMSLFSQVRTGNIILDTFIPTFILTCISYLVKNLYESDYIEYINLWEIDLYEKFKYRFYKKNILKLQGKKYSSLTWSCTANVSSSYSEQFEAVWCKIINTIEDNTSIYEIKDSLSSIVNNHNHAAEEKNKNNAYIVTQKKSFLFDKELQIYATASITTEDTTNEKDKGVSKIDSIDLVLYSYKLSLYDLKTHVERITNEYRDEIEKSRSSNRFIYTLIKTKYEDNKYECWKEGVFASTRTFSNVFFENKSIVLEKLDFFLNQPSWYYKKGIPYTIGFGLHGPPGTGKTSFIKSIAQYTNRHIIVLSLKLIKTRRQLQDFFYEDRYNYNNKKRGVGFDKKIIVIEDIDAQGDIVLDRAKRKQEQSINFSNITEKSNVGEVIKTILEAEKNNETNNVVSTVMKPLDDEPITLDDILNLWDGIEETSGRILIISSNHYADLDPAITRPGRIDVTIEMKNVSHSIISEMYSHLYETPIETNRLENIKEYFYSPAEIINVYLMFKNDSNAFINRLSQNAKVI